MYIFACFAQHGFRVLLFHKLNPLGWLCTRHHASLQGHSELASRLKAHSHAGKGPGEDGEGWGLRSNVERIWCDPQPDDGEGPNYRLHNCQWAATQLCRLFPDANVTVEGVEFPVHRSILSAHSMFFECLFSSGMQEGASQLQLCVQLTRYKCKHKVRLLWI